MWVPNVGNGNSNYGICKRILETDLSWNLPDSVLIDTDLSCPNCTKESRLLKNCYLGSVAISSLVLFVSVCRCCTFSLTVDSTTSYSRRASTNTRKDIPRRSPYLICKSRTLALRCHHQTEHSLWIALR